MLMHDRGQRDRRRAGLTVGVISVAQGDQKSAEAVPFQEVTLSEFVVEGLHEIGGHGGVGHVAACGAANGISAIDVGKNPHAILPCIDP